VQPIRGAVQHYAWGDPLFIPALLGVEPDGEPWAELWLGTHPNGPSSLADGRALAEVTGPLPYLLKVLAAAEPLSMQTHPSRSQAEAGHAEGRYADALAKPELLRALTPFEALCGVRPVDDTVALLDELGVTELGAALRADGPGAAMEALYRDGIDPAPVVDACRASTRPEAVWVVRLDDRYPGDPSVAVTLLLNLVHLAPGESIALGPGNLHAYLAGAGIELMGASDNVVRGGLTTKPVDVDDLLAIVDPTPLAEPVVPSGHELRLPGTNITLLTLEGPTERVATTHELVVTTAGLTGYLAPGATLTVEPDTTAYIATSR